MPPCWTADDRCAAAELDERRATHFAVRTHGRYLIDLHASAAATLVGFHGYQENAATHLEVLRRIAAGRAINLVSVQGLHRFYTRSNTVVAGWMTSEDRELAIADNIHYVAADLAVLRGAGVAVVEQVFEGGHAWDDVFVARARTFLVESVRHFES